MPYERVHTLCSLLVGSGVPFGPRGERSAIAKRPVNDARLLRKTGLSGDEQGDTLRHGGPEKALHHYPAQHYAVWAREHPLLEAKFCIGAFGENISTLGMDESNVCIGDTWELGDAVIQVSQGRQPCWKLNVRFGAPEMARWVQASGRAGWYYRVLKTGILRATDSLKLVARPQPHWPIRRILRVLYIDTLALGELTAMQALPELTEGWRDLARRRIASGRVEDWQSRITMPVVER